jgi:hypothetical protein
MAKNLSILKNQHNHTGAKNVSFGSRFCPNVLEVQRGGLEIGYRFNLNFNTARVSSRPHGTAIK